jgi:hypothetical protein
MAKIFLSHSSQNNREALAMKVWLESQGWKDEVFLDFDPETGIKIVNTGKRRWQKPTSRAMLSFASLHRSGSNHSNVKLSIALQWATAPNIAARSAILGLIDFAFAILNLRSSVVPRAFERSTFVAVIRESHCPAHWQTSYSIQYK